MTAAAIAPGLTVLATDGPLGRVESAVVSPRTGRLATVVVALAFRPRRYVLVPPEWIDHVDEGTVFLTRPVAEALARPIQQRTAEGWLRPAPPEAAPPWPSHRPDDVTLARQVTAALAADPLTADGQVAAAVRHGVATLAGRVRTAAAAFQARRLALDVDGVWHVVNALVSDEALFVAINQRLRLEPALARTPVAIQVDLGQVTLRLAGADPAARGLAEELARAVPGVESVMVAEAAG